MNGQYFLFGFQSMFHLARQYREYGLSLTPPLVL